MNYHQLIVKIHSIKTKVKFVMWVKGEGGKLSQTFPVCFLSSSFRIIFYYSSVSNVRSSYYLTVSQFLIPLPTITLINI